MSFHKEPSGYEKTFLSDLQGAWSCLLDAVINSAPFPAKDKLIFHIHEATSWESVRDLDQMKKVLLLIRNIILQSDADEEVQFWLDEVDQIFRKVLDEILKGKKL